MKNRYFALKLTIESPLGTESVNDILEYFSIEIVSLVWGDISIES